MKESCGKGEMTLDEAIAHLDETLASKKDWSCESCRDEHVQLRKWLAELRSLKAARRTHLDRIADISDAIFMVAKSINESETECIKTLSLLIDEEIEKMEEDK